MCEMSNLKEDLDLADAILERFGDISIDRMIAAGVEEDSLPTLPSLIVMIRRCLDEEKFRAWVDSYIDTQLLHSQPTGATVIGIVRSDSEQHEPEES